MARSDWLRAETLNNILAALMPANSLALRVSMATGLRIGDVLALQTERLKRGNRITIKERKTGKSRRVTIPKQLYNDLLAQAGRIWIFEGRTDYRKHRTRQAVYKDIKRAAMLYRCKGQISPHSVRKVWAVNKYQKIGNVKHVQKLLNHDNEAVTMLYAMADEVTRRYLKHVD